MRYFLVLIVTIILWCTSATSYAQISVNFNIGVQPVWGPTGYDYAEYYYLPDIDCYYYIPMHRFYYFERGRWIYRSSLPSRFGHYDLYNSYKVVVNERDPWRNDNMYRQKYASYKGRHDQQPIRDSRDSKYFVNPKHPEHNNYIQQQKQNNGNRIGQNNGNGAPIQSTGNRIGQNNGNGAPIQSTGNRIGQNKGNVAPKGNNKSPVIRQNTGNQRPTVVKQNNGNKGNNGKGNGNARGNDKGKGNGKENGNKGNGKDK
jgi:hypothetical protein